MSSSSKIAVVQEGCIAHATCGHRVRWTGVIEDGELILGTGCWAHVLDSEGQYMAPRQQ